MLVNARHYAMKVKPVWNCITLHGVWMLMKVPLWQVLTKGVLHQKRAHELINRPDFRMTKCILSRTDQGSDCWESATKHMSWDRIYNSYWSYPVSSVLHHIRGRMGPGIWGYGRVIRRYKWSSTRGNYSTSYCRLRILRPGPKGFADYLYVVLFMPFLCSGVGNRKMVPDYYLLSSQSWTVPLSNLCQTE